MREASRGAELVSPVQGVEVGGALLFPPSALVMATQLVPQQHSGCPLPGLDSLLVPGQPIPRYQWQ